jgi:integrase
LKPPKNNEARTVELPFEGLVSSLGRLIKSNPHGNNADSFVFWADRMADKPIEQNIFLDGLREALQAVGLSEAEAKTYHFHSWRHYYTAHMRGKVDKKVLQKQTGHKTELMLEHYGNHQIEGEREMVQTAQRLSFGRLLPNGGEYVEAARA